MSNPILAIAEEKGEVAEIIRQTRTGVVISGANMERVYDELVRLYGEWEQNGHLCHEPNHREVAKYDVCAQAQTVARVLQS